MRHSVFLGLYFCVFISWDALSCVKKKLARELLRLRRVASATKFSSAAWRSSRNAFMSWDALSYDIKKRDSPHMKFFHALKVSLPFYASGVQDQAMLPLSWFQWTWFPAKYCLRLSQSESRSDSWTRRFPEMQTALPLLWALQGVPWVPLLQYQQ